MTSHLLALLALLVSGAQNDARLVHASRADKAGWIYLHLQGAPRDIGYQYGVLASAEIDDAHRALALNFKTTPYNWSWARKTAKDLFWTKLDQEYKDEIEGQAEGLKSKGYAYDAWDILAYNAYIELKDYYIPYLQSKTTGLRLGSTRDSCSAFIATGSTTKDGKIVMGQNLWWDYVMGQRCNVLLDITPDKGNRLVMDAFCGFIHSGSDFAINSAGLVLCETTISGFFGFDPKGTPEFMRMRKAIQYANNLDDAVKIFKDGNNGGYANTWLIADATHNEIARLELGLKNVTLERSTDGVFVGANYPINPKLIKEETNYDVNDMSQSSAARRVRWGQLISENKGKIDTAAAERFLGDHYDTYEKKEEPSERTLDGHVELSARGYPGWVEPYGTAGAVQNKVADAAMIKEMSFYGAAGHACGLNFKPALHLTAHPEFAWQKDLQRDLDAHPWTKFSAAK